MSRPFWNCANPIFQTHTALDNTVFPQLVITIKIHFRYLPSVTTKRGLNETKVIAIKLSKTNPPKNNRKKG